MPLLRPRLEPGWIAFVPEGQRLRAAHVLPAAQGLPHLAWHWEGEWPDSDAGRRASLAQLRKAHSGLAAGVWVLERGQYQLMATQAPSEVPEAEWRDALRWQLKDQVGFDVADAAIDLLRLPQARHGERQPLLAVLSPRAPLRPLVQALEASGFRLHAIDIPDTALRNLCGRSELPGRAQALLSFGSGHGQLVITHQGELLMARQIDVPASALVDDDDARRDAAIDRTSLEVQRTLDSFERVHTQAALARLLVVPGPGMAALTEHLRGFVPLQLEAFDVAAAIDAPALPGAQAAPWLLALGATLRDTA